MVAQRLRVLESSFLLFVLAAPALELPDAEDFCGGLRATTNQNAREGGALVVDGAALAATMAMPELAETLQFAASAFGAKVLHWLVSLAAWKWLAPGYCQRDPASAEVQTASEVKSDLETLLGDNGNLFRMPVGASGRCTAYPSRRAGLCAEIGHRHQVSAIFEEQPVLVEARAAEVENVWLRAKMNTRTKQLIDSSEVCMLSLKDAICISAFPECDQRDLTPCAIICRNLELCFADLAGGDEEGYRVAEHCKQECSAQQQLSPSLRTAFKDALDGDGAQERHAEGDAPQVDGFVRFLCLMLAIVPVTCLITFWCRRSSRTRDVEEEETSEETSNGNALQPGYGYIPVGRPLKSGCGAGSLLTPCAICIVAVWALWWTLVALHCKGNDW